MHTVDITDGNIEKIGLLFPNCLSEHIGEDGKVEKVIDFDQLRQELSKEIVEGPQERYQFTWPDKKKAIRLSNTASTMTLRPCRDKSVSFDTTENLYIEGDNLEVLKLLRENYLGKIKVIYIDPPYNTGNDFVYEDDFSKSSSEYYENSGQSDETGNRLVQNPESNGRFHTDWLNMIYPRIKVAKDLSDGVIYVSIDDHEIRNLKLILDEVFGASNCILNVVVNRTSEIATDLTVSKHEYCLLYAKDVRNVSSCGQKKYTISRGTVGNVDQTMPEITFPAGIRCVDIPDGVYTQSRQIPGSRENIELITKATVRNSKLAEPVVMKARWRSSNDMRNFFNNNCQPTVAKINGIIEEIYIEGDRFMPQIKKLVAEKIPSLYLDNKRGSVDLERLNLNYFDFPKSVDFVKHLVSLFSRGDSIIMDFFSGSATTAQSVMKLNSEDGGSRKFILVQLPEATDSKSAAYKAGFKDICQLAEERIRRAGKAIRDEQSSNNTKGGLFESLDTLNVPDTGMRVLKLDSSNMEDVYYKPEDSSEATLFEDNVKPDRTGEDLLFQVMLECNLPLSAKIKTEKIAGKEVFSVNNGYLIACFDEDVNEKVITEVAKRKPYYFIMRDKSLSSDNVADNFEQIFQAYSKDTIRRIL